MLFNVHEVHRHIQQLMNQMIILCPFLEFDIFSLVLSTLDHHTPQWTVTASHWSWTSLSNRTKTDSIFTIETLTFSLHHSIKWNSALTRFNSTDGTNLIRIPWNPSIYVDSIQSIILFIRIRWICNEKSHNLKMDMKCLVLKFNL